MRMLLCCLSVYAFDAPKVLSPPRELESLVLFAKSFNKIGLIQDTHVLGVRFEKMFLVPLQLVCQLRCEAEFAALVAFGELITYPNGHEPVVNDEVHIKKVINLVYMHGYDPRGVVHLLQVSGLYPDFKAVYSMVSKLPPLHQPSIHSAIFEKRWKKVRSVCTTRAMHS